MRLRSIGVAAFVVAVAALLLSPSSNPDASYVYSAKGYTQVIDDLIARWLEPTDPFAAPDLPTVRFKPGVEDPNAPRADLAPLGRFVRNSYLHGDLERTDPSLWIVRDGEVRGVNASAHDVDLPVTRIPRWEGDLTFGGTGEPRGQIVGQNGGSTFLAPTTRVLAAGDKDVVTRNPFRDAGGDHAGMRLDFDMGGRVARVFLLGDRLYLRVDEKPSGVDIRVNGTDVGPGRYRALLAGDVLSFDGGGRSATYASGGVQSAGGYISRYQPLAIRSRAARVPNDRTQTFSSAVVRAMDELVATAQSKGVARTDWVRQHSIRTTLDPDLQADLQTLLETYCERLRGGGKGFRAAITVLDAKTGDVLAMASYPATESEGAGTPGYWQRNQNFSRLLIGSEAKPLITSSILEMWPELATLRIPAYHRGIFHSVLGFPLSSGINEVDDFGGGKVDLDSYIQKSSNKFASSLMLLAASARPLVADPPRPPDGYELMGQARRDLPVLPIDRGDQLLALTSTVSWPAELARLYDIHVETAERSGRYDTLDDALYDKTPWSGLFQDIHAPQVFQGEERLFEYASPERVHLALNRALSVRGDYLPVILGGASSQWTTIKVAEAYARLVTGTRVQARLTPARAVPAPMSGCAPDDHVDGLFCKTVQAKLLHAMSLVAYVKGGTAYSQVYPVLSRVVADAGPGVAIGFYSKTGTPEIPDQRVSAEARAANGLIRNGSIVFDPASQFVALKTSDRVVQAQSNQDIPALMAALQGDARIHSILDHERVAPALIAGRLLGFNRSHSPAARGALFTVANGQVRAAPVDFSKSRFGSAYAFVVGRYPAAARGGSAVEVAPYSTPQRAYAVAINVQKIWPQGLKGPHVGAKLGAQVLGKLATRLVGPGAAR